MKPRFNAPVAIAPDVIAEVLDALEVAPASTFRIFPLAVLRIGETAWRPMIGLRADGRPWGLTPTQALHIALCIRAGGFDGPCAGVIASAFELTVAQADHLAAIRNLHDRNSGALQAHTDGETL
jgi:hypothetical protein